MRVSYFLFSAFNSISDTVKLQKVKILLISDSVGHVDKCRVWMVVQVTK